jgi:hypothetical protein
MTRALLCAALSCFSAITYAQDQAERERQMYRAIDLDGDARISREEAQWARDALNGFLAERADAGAGATARAGARPSAAFRRADRNNDGHLTEDELWSAPVSRGGGWVARDEDGDGRVSPAEFSAYQGR